jgi:hypothetical protein
MARRSASDLEMPHRFAARSKTRIVSASSE